MTTAHFGIVVGLLLTLSVTTGGLLGLLLAIVLGGAGWFVGTRLDDGGVDLDSLLRGRRG